MIFICLTPDPEGEHLKIIELQSPPLGAGGWFAFRSRLKVYFGENDKVNGRPLFEETVFEARKAGLAGATVSKGVMSFGASHSVYTQKIVALSGDLPGIVEIIG